MNLNNFEKEVEAKIVDRGFPYYENDCVTEVEQVEKGEFCATVMGTEEYSVLIKLDKKLEIKEHSCDCPYDWGNYCKHKVAVMYYIKDSELYDQPIEKELFYKMKKDLEKHNKGELIKMILDVSKRKKSIREEIMWELGYEAE